MVVHYGSEVNNDASALTYCLARLYTIILYKIDYMNQALIDNSLLGSAFILALLITRFTRQRKAGSIASFFLLFAPLIVFLNMWAHTVAVSIVNIERFQAGTFQYAFSFYALILLGIVFIVVSGVNIDCARKIIKGDLTR